MEERLLHKAIHMADRVMFQVKNEDHEKPTPCSEWDVHMLINHIVYETAWIAPLCEGKTITEVGTALEGDLLGGRPYDAWLKSATQAVHAASIVAPEMIVHLSYTDKPAGEYLDEVAADIIIHSWDLARAIGMDVSIDDETARAAMQATRPILEQGRESGLIGRRRPASKDASEQEKLLAAYGRDINWRYDTAHHHA